ncbi:MAG: hypothetical protein K2N35_02100 [Muribaculaceae bacterium]|nr:hypothetical protein [Muribaculaceae bacterium]
MRFCSHSMFLVVAFLLAGCRSEANNVLDSVKDVEVYVELVKKYVDDNTYIDLDVDALVKGIVNQDPRFSVNEEDMAKMKAAMYRFYKHVSVKDGHYVCGIKEGSEINVSQSVFKTLLENLNEMNRMIKGAKDRGEEIDVQIPDEEYLNTLLL